MLPLPHANGGQPNYEEIKEKCSSDEMAMQELFEYGNSATRTWLHQ